MENGESTSTVRPSEMLVISYNKRIGFAGSPQKIRMEIFNAPGLKAYGILHLHGEVAAPHPLLPLRRKDCDFATRPPWQNGRAQDTVQLPNPASTQLLPIHDIVGSSKLDEIRQTSPI